MKASAVAQQTDTWKNPVDMGWTYREKQAGRQFGSKARQMQDAGLAHGAFAVSDLNVAPGDQIVNLQSLRHQAASELCGL